MTALLWAFGLARSVRKLIPCSGRTVVVPQQPAQPLAATNVRAIARERFWRDQVVAEPLMVPLPMVVGHELVEDADQAPFPEENQAVETLLANRAHEPFRVGVGVRLSFAKTESDSVDDGRCSRDRPS